ncbi:AAA family ATPase [Nocardia sp. NPDC088792]|uniref:AAA family ATPase n=1 Tax=Nocardia sp. NPDC088792 TaxID=3364332 RepID=UPI00382FC9D9
MPELALTAQRNTSSADARWGLVRLHPKALAALGLQPGDGVTLTGTRRTAAVVAAFTPAHRVGAAADPTKVALLDEVTLGNARVREGSEVRIEPAVEAPAQRISLIGSALATAHIPEATLRQALLGKVVTAGDTVTLLPRDLRPNEPWSAISPSVARKALSGLGIAWTSEVLTVTGTHPNGPVTILPSTSVVWDTGAALSDIPQSQFEQTAPAGPALRERPMSPAPMTAVAVADLAGVQAQAAKLTEWLNLALDEPELLKTLGATSQLGVLVTGPAGVGKATLVRAVAGQRRLVELDGPSTGAREAGTRLNEVHRVVGEICSGAGGILLITDVDALLPAEAEPVATMILDQLRAAVASPAVAMIATTSNAVGVDPRLRGPDLCDREVSLPLPTGRVRAALLEQLLRKAPADELKLDEIGARTPGFVVSDLAALVREAALRAAARASREHSEPRLRQEDLTGALEVIRPLSRSGSAELAVGNLSLDDVGDMTETKQALTEAVLWPLQHPDSFARLGIEPPRGVLLYGPPGCGKTYLVRALAGSGQLSVHAVKGAELMDKWVGSSERAVRELFQRARDSAPSLIFLDEVDALAPRRGQSSDSGVSDRVVAALLTELDGVEPLRDVVVVAATNRPELIDPALTRPGRLERMVFVPPPDAAARAEILRTAAKSVPLAKDVNLRKLAQGLDGYSAADCSALLREAALAAMRRDVDAADVTAADVAAARAAVRPSLDPMQVESLCLYAEQRVPGPAGTAEGYV